MKQIVSERLERPSLAVMRVISKLHLLYKLIYLKTIIFVKISNENGPKMHYYLTPSPFRNSGTCQADFEKLTVVTQFTFTIL